MKANDSSFGASNTADQAAWLVPPANQTDLDGTDLRWFAGMAMQAIIGKIGVPTSESLREEIALWSYRMAEDMVKTDERLHPH